jgi:hypothetical protein
MHAVRAYIRGRAAAGENEFSIGELTSALGLDPAAVHICIIALVHQRTLAVLPRRPEDAGIDAMRVRILPAP